MRSLFSIHGEETKHLRINTHISTPRAPRKPVEKTNNSLDACVCTWSNIYFDIWLPRPSILISGYHVLLGLYYKIGWRSMRGIIQNPCTKDVHGVGLHPLEIDRTKTCTETWEVFGAVKH